MKYPLQKSLLTLAIFGVIGVGMAQGWSGLIATPGDVITAAKWNSMIYNTLPISSTGGSVGINDSSPSHTLDVNGNIGLAPSTYINFGSTDGTSGYGFRDNAGTIQYKNSAGIWANIPAAYVPDNMGNHTATQNIALNSFWLSNDGTNQGIYISTGGNVGAGTSLPMTKLDVGGDISFDFGSDYITGGILNNVVLGGGTNSNVRYTAALNGTIGGITGGQNGKILLIHNASAYKLRLDDQSGSSLAANRILAGGSGGTTLSPDQSALLAYDPTKSMWRVVDSTPRRYVYRMLASQASTVVAYANATALTSVTLPVGAYKFKALLKYRSAATTTGIGLQMGLVSGAITNYADLLRIRYTTAGTASSYITSNNTIGTATNVASVATANTDYAADIDGTFEVTTAAVTAVQFRTSAAGSAVTLGTGSYLTIEPLY